MENHAGDIENRGLFLLLGERRYGFKDKVKFFKNPIVLSLSWKYEYKFMILYIIYMYIHTYRNYLCIY